MPEKDPDATLLLAAGAAAVALGAGAWLLYQANEERKKPFFHALGRFLEERGLAFVDANFGRTSGGAGLWSVTYNTPSGVTRIGRVPLPPEVEPYSESVARQVASALPA